MPKKRGRQRRGSTTTKSPLDIAINFPGTKEEREQFLEDLKKGPRKLGLTVTPPKKKKKPKDPTRHA